LGKVGWSTIQDTPAYLLIADLVGLVGNWTADKSDYSTTIEANALYAPVNFGDDWNKTYADLLYADIGVTGDNSSWNESHADTLYADIGVVDTNILTDADFNATQMENSGGKLNILESWLTTFFNSLFSGKDTDDLTEGSTNKYDNQSWTEVVADGLYADIGVTGDNSSWSETLADTLYSPINYGDDWNKTYADGLYEAIDHTHPASEITAGTFGTGNYVMDTNLTTEKIVFENSASHFMEDNSTCVKIYGDSSVLEIC